MPRPFSSGLEKANLPTGGKPHLLLGSVVELQEEMKCYISFSAEDVFNGIALPEETPHNPIQRSHSREHPANTEPTPLVKKATLDTTMEPTVEKRPLNKFPGWEKVLHPSRPIVTARQIPPLLRGPRWQRPCS